ncbi:hypothetical protein KO507_02005 [Gilvimarinus agarilyticus]|uniref:hypothetical protein n=1 Tax=Gilvimarinus sp. 2_MG-2023 TaxID=3062666 RepID=UPI001C090C96|nr:hypothetical protein [Gilvimarinus sp. 2_MG-2023]MBU2884535.1 hypothetical protein [Gilvimarinus agarilyticus]MDO6569663.1 hypothetical protein [Gilvimarinus sp. 2_MG-2023]
MLEEITRRCPEIELPDLVSKKTVNDEMHDKVGPEYFPKLYSMIAQSDLRTNALKTIDKLFEQVDGCNDPALNRSILRLEQVHNRSYEKFKAEEPTARSEPVPIPMRRDN